MQDKLKANQNRISTVADKVEELQKEYLELEAVDNRDVTKEFAFRAKARDLNNACKEFDKLKQELDRTYEMKAKALMEREKNAIDRLQKQQEVDYC